MAKHEPLTILAPAVRRWLNLTMLKIGTNLGEVKLGKTERTRFQVVGRAAIGLDQLARAVADDDVVEIRRVLLSHGYSLPEGWRGAQGTAYVIGSDHEYGEAIGARVFGVYTDPALAKAHAEAIGEPISEIPLGGLPEQVAAGLSHFRVALYGTLDTVERSTVERSEPYERLDHITHAPDDVRFFICLWARDEADAVHLATLRKRAMREEIREQGERFMATVQERELREREVK